MSSKANADFLMEKAMEAGIKDPKELANFMGQMQVESGGYTRMNENLGYSGKRLLEVFPGRNGLHDIDKANAIASGGPEAVANAIYGGSWGKRNLGNIEPGDGWKYHGRGYVQLTGHDNYARVGKELGLDLVNHPELAEDREIAAKIAVHYWESRVVPNGHQKDVTGACHDINGGEKGLHERKVAAAAWEGKLAHGYVPGGADSPAHGHRSDDARHVQQLLNDHGYRDEHGKPLKVDGDMGARTRHAIEDFQREQHLKADGVAGPATLQRLEALVQQSKHAPQQLDQPGHPGNAMYRQALDAVTALDKEHQRAPDQHTVNFAGALTAAARHDGLSRIDHVVLSADAQRAFAVQGDLNSPFKRMAEVSTLEATATPLARSSDAWTAATPPPVAAPTQPSQDQAMRQAP